MGIHMNVFRFLGDMSHLLSFFVLYHKIHRTRSCKGAASRTAAGSTVLSDEDKRGEQQHRVRICRHISQDAGAVRIGVLYALSGSVLQLQFSVRASSWHNLGGKAASKPVNILKFT
jgi:hypothetical protein